MNGRMSLRPPDKNFLIWSYEHQAWWRPNERGYTYNWKEAGAYPRKNAQRIVDEAHGMEVMLPAEAVFQLIGAYVRYLSQETGYIKP